MAAAVTPNIKDAHVRTWDVNGYDVHVWMCVCACVYACMCACMYACVHVCMCARVSCVCYVQLIIVGAAGTTHDYDTIKTAAITHGVPVVSDGWIHESNAQGEAAMCRV